MNVGSTSIVSDALNIAVNMFRDKQQLATLNAKKAIVEFDQELTSELADALSPKFAQEQNTASKSSSSIDIKV